MAQNTLQRRRDGEGHNGKMPCNVPGFIITPFFTLEGNSLRNCIETRFTAWEKGGTHSPAAERESNTYSKPRSFGFFSSFLPTPSTAERVIYCLNLTLLSNRRSERGRFLSLFLFFSAIAIMVYLPPPNVIDTPARFRFVGRFSPPRPPSLPHRPTPVLSDSALVVRINHFGNESGIVQKKPLLPRSLTDLCPHGFALLFRNCKGGRNPAAGGGEAVTASSPTARRVSLPTEKD